MSYCPLQNKMIELMAEQLTSDYHGKNWVINYYREKAINELKKEKHVMKVMISTPMSGIPDEQVKTLLDKITKDFEKLHIEVVHSFFIEDCPDDYINEKLYYVSKSVEIMGKVDAVYFTRDWQTSRGCRIERQIAEAYNIKILDWWFLYPDNQSIKDFGKELIFKDCGLTGEIATYTISSMDNENHIPKIN